MPGRLGLGGMLTMAALLAVLAGAATTAAASASDAADAIPDYNVVTWTAEDGLISNNIFALTQDRKGYLWLGTDEGIIRFDGLRFIGWNALSRIPLPERRVLSLLTSADGSVWIGFGGAGGISRVHDGEVTTYSPQEGVPHDFIRVLRQDRQGAIWAISPSGVYRYRGQRWEKVGAESGLLEGPFWNAYEDSHGNFWIVSSAGIVRRDAGTESFHAVQTTTTRVRDLAEDPQGTLLMTDPVLGFRTLVDHTNVQLLPPSREGFGARLLSDSKGLLWIGTQGQGLWQAIRGGVSSGSPVYTVTTRSTLSGQDVRSIVEDRDGNVWVGSSRGLHRFSPRTVNEIGGLGLVRTVAATADGMTWVGTANGLFRITPAGRRERLLPSSIFALHSDARGVLWIGTDHGLFNFENGRFTEIRVVGPPLGQIVAIASDSQGAVWICDQNRGVVAWKNGELKMPWPELDRPAYALFVGTGDRVWVVLKGGMFGLVTAEHAKLFGPTGDGSLRVIFEGRDQTVWLGGDDGLTRFANGRLLTAGRANGLPGNAVLAAVEDMEGNIWAGMSSGIIRVNPREFDALAANPSYQIRYTLFDRSAGLTSTPEWFSTPSSVRGPDGKLWFVIADGLAAVDPARLKSTQVELHADIEAAVADDQTVESTQNAVLPPFTRRLQIEYTAVNLVSPLQVRFRYRLDGFDRDWIDVGTRRQAFYTNLPPRNYRFRVAAATSEGRWNESSTSWAFSIQPAFYQTRAFVVFALMMSLTLALLGWQLHLQRVRRQMALVLTERARLSRQLHDTLLQSLVGVALQFEGLAQRVDTSSPTLKEHFGRMRLQVEEYIREARQSILDLRSPSAERSLIEAFREASERLMSSCQARFEFEVSGNPRRLHHNVEDQLFNIGREALRNAVRHANAAHVRLELLYGDRSVRLRVMDDGVGFDGNPVKGHYGLTNMEERARQLGGRLSLVTSPGHGTQIDVLCPIRVTLRERLYARR